MKVLKFGAGWCSGCLVMKPIWSEIEEEMPWLETEYYDYDEAEETVAKYKVDEKLPTFIFLDKDGREFLRLQGEVDKDRLEEIINDNKDR